MAGRNRNPTSTSVTTALAGKGPAVRTTTPTESAALLLDVCGNLLLTEEEDQATAACFLEIEAVTSRVSAAVFQNAVRVPLYPRGEEQAFGPDTRGGTGPAIPNQYQSQAGGLRLGPLVKNHLFPLLEYFKYFSQNSLPFYN